MIRNVVLAAAGCLLLAGCASLTSGHGSGSGAPVAATSGPASSPAPAASTPATEPATSSSPASSSPTSGGSCPGAFCDDFSSPRSGWEVGNERFFYTQYSSYQGGTLRMGERHDSILTDPAPYDITRAAADRSVRIDVQAVLGPKSPADAVYGVTCWNHRSRAGDTAAFLFEFTKSGADIVLWDDRTGDTHVLRHKSWRNVLLAPPARNAVRVLCENRTSGGTATAELGMSVNGHVLIKLYPKNGKNAAWSTGKQVGLLVGLTHADVFYDNFVITGECQGTRC